MTFAARILLAELLRQVSASLLPATLILAPWLFGGTRGWTVDLLTALLAVAGGCWLVASVLDPHGGRLPLTLAAAVLWLLAGAVLVTALRPVFPDDPFMVEQLRAVRVMAPGAFAAREPWRVCRFVASALLALLVMTDLARERRWWLRFYQVSIVAGASTALLGIVQLALHAPAMLWDTAMPAANDRFFGAFFHSAPAGAYLNLTWPLAWAGVLGEFRERGGRAWRRPFFWGQLAAAEVGLVALFCQTARTAQGLGLAVFLLLVVTALLLPARSRRPSSGRKPWVGLICALAACGLAAVALAWLPLFAETRGRWLEFATEGRETPPPADAPPVVWDSSGRGDRIIDSDSPTRGQFLWDRRLAWDTARRMISARPWLGYGLGGWTPAYSHFTSDPFLKTFVFYLQFTHQGFLQIVVEWGVLGALGWAVLVLGGVWRGLVAWSRHRDDPARRLQLAAILCALATLGLHACLDFALEIPALQLQALCFFALLWSENPRRQG